MANFIHFRRARRSSTSSIYMKLLSTLASDLDNMLSELCTTPPPPYDRLSDNELHNRQTTSFNVARQPNGGTRLTLGQGGRIDLGNNHISANAIFSKQFNPNSFTTFGGNLDFQNRQTGTSFQGSLDKTARYGTDLSIGGSQTLYQNGNGQLVANGGLNQHFGGHRGTGNPDFNVGLTFKFIPPPPPSGDMQVCSVVGGRVSCK